MNIQSILLLAVILAGAVYGLRVAFTGGSCSCGSKRCSGQCAGCSCHCDKAQRSTHTKAKNI